MSKKRKKKTKSNRRKRTEEQPEEKESSKNEEENSHWKEYRQEKRQSKRPRVTSLTVGRILGAVRDAKDVDGFRPSHSTRRHAPRNGQPDREEHGAAVVVITLRLENAQGVHCQVADTQRQHDSARQRRRNGVGRLGYECVAKTTAYCGASAVAQDEHGAQGGTRRQGV